MNCTSCGKDLAACSSTMTVLDHRGTTIICGDCLGNRLNAIHQANELGDACCQAIEATAGCERTP